MWRKNNTTNQIFRITRGVYKTRRYRNKKWFMLQPIYKNGRARFYLGYNPFGNRRNREGRFLS